MSFRSRRAHPAHPAHPGRPGRPARIAAAGAIAAGIIAASALGLRAELPEWVKNIEATGRLHDAVFRTVPTLTGPVEVRRAPADAYDALTRAASSGRSPGQAQGQGEGAPAAELSLLALRARTAEEKLDAKAAEADWTAYARASADAGAGQLALADFYHRRLLPQQEADTLATAAQATDPPADRLLPATARRSWRTFERLFALVGAQQLPDAFAEQQARAWIARYPQEPAPYDRLFQFLVARDRAADAETLLARYHQAFPADETWVLKGRAALATRRGATDDALAVYDQAFKPLWDAGLVQEYFALLERTHRLRAFLDRARADVAAHPDDVTPVARIFYYYHRAGNIAAAEQALADFEARRDKGSRSAVELFTLAQLYEKTRNLNEALRYYASIYSLPGAAPADVEQALARIIETLFSAPEQPLRFGSGDLSFYRDVATLDRSPGFLNGVLSLLFNSIAPSEEYAREEATAASYFHRGRAADLLTLFDKRFPDSSRRPALNATLIATYATYGESAAVIERGRRFMTSFQGAPQRMEVAMAMADAFARTEQVAEEIATYDRLLEELAARADRVPLGEGTTGSDERRASRPAGARSQDYARVLDRYIARLVSRKELPAALAVYQREIGRNPDDPGLYAAAAQFLEQNNFTAEVEQVYRLALAQFPDPSWHHRLARWYLRKRQAAAFEGLTRDVTKTFAGSDLARYFDAVVARGPDVNAQLFLQLNLYANERFPHQPIFVRNLLSAYTTRETNDPAAYEALLRRHWFEDESLAATFFATLASHNRLDAEIAGVRGLEAAAGEGDWPRLAKANPLAARFLAEADVWRSQFESATPVLAALAGEFPADAALGQRAASLHRSLSYADARETDAAARTLERLHQYDPRDTATLTTLGEIYADRDRYDRARTPWDRLMAIEPGQPAGYLEAATLFWDYFQFDEAQRAIAAGRTQLRDPALYAYEAGAIYEGQRQPARAIDEYARGALAAADQAPARGRLLTLAKRKAYRDLADRASAAAAEGPAPSPEAVSLRIAVLEAQSRRDDLQAFLQALLDRTSSLELMADIGSQAERLGFEAVRTRSLAKQIALMQDPIDKLRLRYALVRLYESRGELDLARQTLDTLYTEHPRILGIVRQTVDYYWRHDLRRDAIAVLTRTAASSYPALRTQFTFEAARKSSSIGDYAQARDLMKPLLAAEPFNADYLAAVADTYALAKDDAALRDFYAATIEQLRSAPMAADERTRRVAGLRRALIPALARLNDHAGAIDQYVEIINRYPEDEALLQEAGRYARQHARTEQLLAYYTKTAAASPRDYRWPMLVARLQTQFEDFPAAIAAYAAAIAIRPDRVDLYTARATLEERLLRFDAAMESYGKTYELTYHDAQWMEKIAELRARLGRADAAAAALRTALIDGRPERAETFFTAAGRLETWNMLDAAKPFADQGATVAGPAGLLESGGVYVRIYTRLRQTGAAFDRLLTARRDALAAAEANADPNRLTQALSARLGEMAAIVARDFTPEEKVQLAAFLEQQKGVLPRGDAISLLLPLAERAGLVDLAVRWRSASLDADGLRESSGGDLSRLIELQTSRLRFAELAKALERLADAGGVPALVHQARVAAAESYDKAADEAGVMRVLSRMPLVSLPEGLLARYFEVLLERDPPRLIALAGSGSRTVRDAAANYIVEHGTADQALSAVRARGQGLPPVWTNAYTALVGFHFARYDAATTGAFSTALGAQTIADRLKPADRATQLAGDTWFAYGSRFGEYLAFAKQPGAEDYLPAQIERTPARSEAYVTLADFYRDRGAGDDALAEYDRAAVLNARRSDVHLRAAAILWRQGKRADAKARWTKAMQLLTTAGGRAPVETAPFVTVLDALGSRKLLPELREPADAMARAYIGRNGAYGADTLFAAAFRAAGDAASGTDWLVDLAGAAPNPIDALGAIAKASWLPDLQRDRVYERIITLSDAAVARQFGAAQSAAQAQLERWRVERLRSLVDTKQAARAEAWLRAWPEDAASRQAAGTVTLEARIAAALGTLDPLLDRYARDESLPVNLDALRDAATALRRGGQAAPARRIMEFVYTRQLDRDELSAPIFLGLAEIRLQQANLPAAMELLHRLTLVTGEPFENLAACGALLERLNHPAEALEFRRARVQAAPWDTAAQIALARAEMADAKDRAGALARLARITGSPAEHYAARVEAARLFASSGGQLDRPPASELDWLRAPASMTVAAADQPMFVAARLAYAERTPAPEPAARAALLMAAVASDPGNIGLRVPLFRAWLAADKPVDAIDAIQPVLRHGRTLTNIGLTAADRARLARELGDAHRRRDRLPEAVRFYTLALEGQTAVERKALRARMATINEEIARRGRNAARRPRIGETLDQAQLVRPRILPASLSSPASPAPPAAAPASPVSPPPARPAMPAQGAAR
jgi:tetratricopeptide (TPR) repeat protein/predicted Zn-dependent protease